MLLNNLPLWTKLILGLWLIRETKKLLLWLYLWQLKEYHWGRLLAHFNTALGKKLLWNKLKWTKILLIAALMLTSKIATPGLGVIIAGLLLLEAARAVVQLVRGSLKKPDFTQKTTLLTLLVLGGELWFGLFLLGLEFESFLIGLLVFDLLTPVIVTLIVFILEPAVNFKKKRILEQAKRKRDKFDELLVIGITGSYGKTSTKKYLSKILSQKFNVLKTKQHVNTEMGIAETILNDLKQKHDIFVAEIGAYEKGQISQVSSFLSPDIGLLTGINEQHLSTFGSQQNIIDGKYELIEVLPNRQTKTPAGSEETFPDSPAGRHSSALAVFNGYNDYCRDLYEKTEIPKKIVGPQGDLEAQNIEVGKESVSFEVIKDNETFEFELNVLGKEQIQNFLMAVVTANNLEISLKEISAFSKQTDLQESQLIKGDEFNVIDSSYSANPDGVIAQVNYLQQWNGKRAIVMPCLIELGNKAAKVHERIGRKIGEVCDLAIITSEDYFKEVKKEATKKMDSDSILLMKNPDHILQKLQNYNNPEDIILLESRVPQWLKNKLF